VPRTVVLLNDHLTAIVTRLTSTMTALASPVYVGYGERPVNPATKQHYPPPYLVVSYLPGGTLDGSLSDSQADVAIRILINSMGNSAQEATIVRDIAHADMMDKSNFTITNRKIRNLSLEIPSDGTYRDDDAPTPIFYTRQIYILDTTPT